MKIYRGSENYVPSVSVDGVNIFFKFSFTLLSFLIFIILVTPEEVIPDYFKYILFFLISFLSLLNIILFGKSVPKKFYMLFSLIILMLPVILISHVKGVFFSVSLSWNDFSDYLKFILPMIISISAYYACLGGGSSLISFPVRLSAFIYSLFFLFYLFFGFDFVYSLGLGSGSEVYYRYGGIDRNPNAYAAIAISFIFFLFIAQKKISTFNCFVIALLILSVILSQSRTSIITFSFLLFLAFVSYRLSLFSKILGLLIVSIVGWLAFYSFDLYWLTQPGRFNIASDNSFLTRLNNSFEQLARYGDDVGIFGIGPGKNELDRLDTITYLMYYLRYGIVGIFCFISLHFFIAIYFFRKYIKYKKIKVFSYQSRVFFVNSIFPIYVLMANVSNEKWIDIKFLLVWFLMISLGVFWLRAIDEDVNLYA